MKIKRRRCHVDNFPLSGRRRSDQSAVMTMCHDREVHQGNAAAYPYRANDRRLPMSQAQRTQRIPLVVPAQFFTLFPPDTRKASVSDTIRRFSIDASRMHRIVFPPFGLEDRFADQRKL